MEGSGGRLLEGNRTETGSRTVPVQLAAAAWRKPSRANVAGGDRRA